MIKQICGLSIPGILMFASAGFAQYTMDLTSAGNVISGNVYVSPYQGTISQNGNPIFNGMMICDDYSTESALNTPWNAVATSATSLNGNEKFKTATYSDAAFQTTTTQQDYDAAAYLANELIGVVGSPSLQINYSFAIWDIFDKSTPDPTGGAAQVLIDAAFNAVKNGPVYTNVSVFTASPNTGVSQEFLVVNGPAISAPEPAAAALLGLDLLSVLAAFFLLRRYRVRA